MVYFDKGLGIIFWRQNILPSILKLGKQKGGAVTIRTPVIQIRHIGRVDHPHANALEFFFKDCTSRIVLINVHVAAVVMLDPSFAARCHLKKTEKSPCRAVCVRVNFFCQALGAPIPLLRTHAVARTQCACKNFVVDQYGDHVLTCKKHTGAIAGHDHVMNVCRRNWLATAD